MTDPDPVPEALAADHDDVLRSENTFEIDTESLESARDRAERGWGVGALAVHDGRVLLVRHDDQWLLPGGMLESGETPGEGAARETHEETGIDVRIDGLAAIAEQTFTDGDDAFVFHFAVFEATPESTVLTDDPGLTDEAIAEAAWHGSLPADTFEPDLYARLLDGRLD
ncbi:NUDIX hydrolase [Halococcus agarilyticus]|uniref:NUDIX hydrolase n=1 Tax=Halococcus agarilyticus TaxID=1232219 RepID=UPI00067781E7|nr:NUDIX hydrolase [Halococcus agarilyticus]